MNPRLRWLVGTSAACLALSGCGGPDTTYGRSNNSSLNGTGAFADLLRARGHEVRTARRLTDELRDWAEVVVRFAPSPGPPPADEAQWYDNWMTTHRDSRILYVPRDFDALPGYWSRVLKGLPPDAPARLGTRVRDALAEAEKASGRPVVTPPMGMPFKPKPRAGPKEWFAVKSTTDPPKVCETLSGRWAAGVDAKGAGLTRHETLKVDEEVVLLRGDDEPLAMSWIRQNGGRVLVVANGCFLLNEPLAEPARRPLAVRAADWVGGLEIEDEDEYSEEAGPGRRKRVAFVEGGLLLTPTAAQPSVFAILTVHPFGWVVGQLLLLGLAGCLARAPRLGKARPEEPSGADRPVAHPEALGILLARTGQAREARAILESYRKWRTGPVSRGSPRVG